MASGLSPVCGSIAVPYGGFSAVVFRFLDGVNRSESVGGRSTQLEKTLDAELYLDRCATSRAEAKLPATEEMRALAAANPPPQSWYDEEFDGL
jgi:hypothetical protein